MLSKNSAAIEQCYLNILSGLAHHNLPLPATVFAKQTDRIIVSGPFYMNGITTAPWGFEKALDQLVDLGVFVKIPFEDPKVLHGPTAVASYRELDNPSMQCVKHDTGVWEIDFDLFCPDVRAGLAAPLCHAIEVLWPGKTNPYRVRRGLMTRGVYVPEVSKV